MSGSKAAAMPRKREDVATALLSDTYGKGAEMLLTKGLGAEAKACGISASSLASSAMAGPSLAVLAPVRSPMGQG